MTAVVPKKDELVAQSGRLAPASELGPLFLHAFQWVVYLANSLMGCVGEFTNEHRNLLVMKAP